MRHQVMYQNSKEHHRKGKGVRFWSTSDNTDLQILRSIPIRPGQLSPTELLSHSQCKYKALLPIHKYLHPNLELSREAQIAQEQTQVDYYNQKAKQLHDLNHYQNVCAQLDPNKPVWQRAMVIQQPTDRSPKSCYVQTEFGARYFRNCWHLSPVILSGQPEDPIGKPAIPAESVTPKSHQWISSTRHCRCSVCKTTHIPAL